MFVQELVKKTAVVGRKFPLKSCFDITLSKRIDIFQKLTDLSHNMYIISYKYDLKVEGTKENKKEKFIDSSHDSSHYPKKIRNTFENMAIY